MPISDHCLVEQLNGSPFHLYYQLHGNGPERVLFIGGLNMGVAGWEFQCEYFTKQGGYTICVYDQRGCSRSDTPPGNYATTDMARDALFLLKHLKWNRDIHVVGSSLGGMVAQELALVAPPSLIKTLTLVSTHAGLTTPPLYGMYNTMRSLIAEDMDARVELSLKALFPEEWLSTPNEDPIFDSNRSWVRNVLQQRVIQHPISSSAGVKAQMAASLGHHVSREKLNSLGERGYAILVVTGDEDYMVKPSNSEYLAKELNAKLKVLKGCGHAPHLQERHAFNQLLQAHFESRNN